MSLNNKKKRSGVFNLWFQSRQAKCRSCTRAFAAVPSTSADICRRLSASRTARSERCRTRTSSMSSMSYSIQAIFLLQFEQSLVLSTEQIKNMRNIKKQSSSAVKWKIKDTESENFVRLSDRYYKLSRKCDAHRRSEEGITFCIWMENNFESIGELRFQLFHTTLPVSRFRNQLEWIRRNGETVVNNCILNDF